MAREVCAPNPKHTFTINYSKKPISIIYDIEFGGVSRDVKVGDLPGHDSHVVIDPCLNPGSWVSMLVNSVAHLEYICVAVTEARPTELVTIAQ